MIKLIAAAGFLVAVATSAHAITPAPIPQPDGMLSQVRFGRGPLRTELLVSAWPEPLSAIPADSAAEPTAGAIVLSRTVQSRLHRLHCATDCAIQCVGLSAVASGKPALYLAPLPCGAFSLALVSAAQHRNQ